MSEVEVLKPPEQKDGYLTNAAISSFLRQLYTNPSQLQRHTGYLHGRLIEAAIRGYLPVIVRCTICHKGPKTPRCKGRGQHGDLDVRMQLEISVNSLLHLTSEDFRERVRNVGPQTTLDFERLLSSL